MRAVDLGVHLPLLSFGGEPLSLRRLADAVDGARECGFAAVSANDHFVFAAPWLDGPTALAAVVERSGDLELATTLVLAVLRGPVPLAKALAAIDLLSEGRLIAAVGPGSSARDYAAVGLAFDERWSRLEEAIAVLRALLGNAPLPADPRHYPLPDDFALAPGPHRPGGIPLWVASWGSPAGLARVARAGDGWLASAYNTTPERFAAGRADLALRLRERGRAAQGFPTGLSTMWTWVAADPAEGERVLNETLAPLLGRDPADVGAQVCVGTAEHCAQLLARYARAGCDRVYLWPLGDERRQLELVAGAVAPLVRAEASDPLRRIPPQ
jgi:alkanesulfonate monooxygenase SsuD/methylene tetrahydromethanopterin reductase-like flavin-dependent oxidoreductase (luciferase family)